MAKQNEKGIISDIKKIVSKLVTNTDFVLKYLL